MPTYVYGCQECGAQFEQFQRFSDEPLTICPRCQGSIRRIFQPVGIVFKGGGWYVNDSRSNNSAATPAKAEAKSGEDAAAPAKAEGGDSAKPAASETKPAASETKPAASAA